MPTGVAHMSSPTPTTAPSVAPFLVYSVHFNFPGGQAIELRNPATNQPIGAAPEWVFGARNETAAYRRGIRVEILVSFRGTTAANGTYTVGADGTPFQIEERQVNLIFDPVTGLCNPEVLRASGDLPDQIGVHAAKLDWYIRVQPAPAHCPQAGTSTHRICTTWRAMRPNASQELHYWVYKPLMEWSSEWATGRDNEKEICDAILEGARASNLRYGDPLRVRD